MIDVNSNEVRLQLLQHLMSLIKAGQEDFLDELGLPAAEQQRLGALDYQQMLALADMRCARFTVRYDFTRLKFALDTLLDVRERQSKVDYFIRHGASEAQLREYFGLTREVVRNKRPALLPDHKTGRPALPLTNVRERIAAAWESLQADDSVERYMRLHAQFPDVSIAALETVVREYARLPT